jgi:hypothetical protein
MLIRTTTDPLAAVTLTATPQTTPIPGRPQVRDAAGGYVFAKDQWNQVEDFLILGTTVGTYYVGTYYGGADELTRPNVGVLFGAIAADEAPREHGAPGRLLDRRDLPHRRRRGNHRRPHPP